jgi:pimeloyl-ACP methyl ester carboxylesterase
MFIETSLAVAIETWEDISKFEPAPIAAELRMPTIFIHGEDDEFTPTSASEESVAAAANGRLAIVKDCGHLVMIEQRQWFQATLEAFLKEVL